MKSKRIDQRRRRIMLAAAATAGVFGVPTIARAQAEPIRIGTLSPLTGSGGLFGPGMVKSISAVIDEVNAAGGILGRRVQLFTEDDQTNPEAGLRGARKLIEVNKVSAIVGTWASSVTTAIAPLCWESKTFITCCSGADSIVRLPHQGYLMRTNPSTALAGRKFGEFAIGMGAKRVAFMSPQTPFASSLMEGITLAMTKVNGSVESLIYDDKKPTYRAEIDKVMRANPDAIIMGGFTPDVAVLVKDLYRASFKGTLIGYAHAVNSKLTEGVPAEVVEGVYGMGPSPAEGSGGYKHVVRLLKIEAPDTYQCQVYDQISLVLLAMAQAKETTGAAVRGAIRSVSQGGGKTISNAVEGLKLISSGQKVDFDGASSQCELTENGDVTDAVFRYEQIRGGKVNLVKVA